MRQSTSHETNGQAKTEDGVQHAPDFLSILRHCCLVVKISINILEFIFGNNQFNVRISKLIIAIRMVMISLSVGPDLLCAAFVVRQDWACSMTTVVKYKLMIR